MNNKDYWAQRMEILQSRLLKQGSDCTLEIERQFNKAILAIEADMAKWYHRVAKNQGVSLAEARRLLNSRELEEFRWTVEEYVEKGKSLDTQWLKQLENASARVHITRYDALKLQLQQKAELLYGNQLDKLDTTLRTIYKEGYSRMAFEVQRGTGVGRSMQTIDERLLDKVLAKPWTADDRTFRDRCWQDKEALVRSVDKNLTHMMMQGKGPDDAIKAIAKEFNVSKGKAGRLVMTESAALASAARGDCYGDLEVERYQIIETLDVHTCELCSSMDGKDFAIDERKPGMTAPPFHPWCRGTDAPYFADMEGTGERFARDETGKHYYVPKDMTYKQWEAEYMGKGLKNEQDSGIIQPQEKTRIHGGASGSQIEQRNTGKGNPSAILHAGKPLNTRQQKILDGLPDFASRVVVSKKNVSMKDLAALTAETGNEFALFTKGANRLVIRGNACQVQVNGKIAEALCKDGYRWSGHTHPGFDFNCLMASPGDYLVLTKFPQKLGVVYNSKGQYLTFQNTRKDR